jgi:exopolysaccharide biosynthesis protein
MMPAYRYSKVRLHETDIHLLFLNLRQVNLFITPSDDGIMAPTRVPESAVKYKQLGAINLDQFIYMAGGSQVRIAGETASAGKVYGGFIPEWTVWLSDKNQISLKKPKKVWNAIPFNHVLVEHGKPYRYYDGSVYARTCIGWKNNTMIWMVSEGEEGRNGLTIGQSANFMAEIGAAWAGQCDSGHSPGMFLDGKLISSPRDEIANCIGFSVKGTK